MAGEVNLVAVEKCRMQFLNARSGRQKTLGLPGSSALDSKPASLRLLHQSIVDPHQLCFVVILQHQLPRPQFRLLPQNHFRTQVPL